MRASSAAFPSLDIPSNRHKGVQIIFVDRDEYTPSIPAICAVRACAAASRTLKLASIERVLLTDMQMALLLTFPLETPGHRSRAKR